jgi:hypothetical protein
VKRAQAVGKARMLSPLVGEKTDTQLPDTAQALKLRGVDKADQEPAFVRICREADYVMN